MLFSRDLTVMPGNIRLQNELYQVGLPSHSIRNIFLFSKYFSYLCYTSNMHINSRKKIQIKIFYLLKNCVLREGYGPFLSNNPQNERRDSKNKSQPIVISENKKNAGGGQDTWRNFRRDKADGIRLLKNGLEIYSSTQLREVLLER